MNSLNKIKQKQCIKKKKKKPILGKLIYLKTKSKEKKILTNSSLPSIKQNF